MDTFTNKFDEKIRPLMDRIDQARTLLSGSIEGITFPTVVVVGDQSSGKSTLLEALSLVELPKGNGIVTRCPLVLRLRKSNERKVYRLHDDDQKTLLDEDEMNIMKYIVDETNKLAGREKNVVKDLIELQVEDPNVRDLTVVDLPGIARNPIADQPKDIHAQTTGLIQHYIKQEGSVILCVFPANVDAGTVESFTLARKVDPKGIRTIGVITKADLAPDDHQLCQQLLMENKDVLQLKLGFIAVRNRTADEKIDLSEARQREKEFFKEHVASSVVGLHCLGIEALINRLADLYAERVQKTLPETRNQIQNKLENVREQLIKFPPDLDTSTMRLAKYHELSDFYVENVLKTILSRSDDDQLSLVNQFHDTFKTFDKLLQKETEQLHSPKYVAKVSRALQACAGEQLPNFLPHQLLKRFANEKIDNLWRITESLVNDCFSKTLGLFFNKANDRYARGDMWFDKMRPAFANILKKYLIQQKESVVHQLQGLIELEKDEAYTLNSTYMEQYFIGKNREPSSDEPFVNEMVQSVRSYWQVIRKRFMDYAALAIRSRFVFSVCHGMRERLRCVPSEQRDFVDGYLTEDAHTRAERTKLQQTCDLLEKALEVLGGATYGGANANSLMKSDESELSTMLLDYLSDSDEESDKK